MFRRRVSSGNQLRIARQKKASTVNETLTRPAIPIPRPRGVFKKKKRKIEREKKKVHRQRSGLEVVVKGNSLHSEIAAYKGATGGG